MDLNFKEEMKQIHFKFMWCKCRSIKSEIDDDNHIM